MRILHRADRRSPRVDAADRAVDDAGARRSRREERAPGRVPAQQLLVDATIAAPVVNRENLSATDGLQTLARVGTNEAWAKLVLMFGGWPQTDANVTVMLRWMRQENGTAGLVEPQQPAEQRLRFGRRRGSRQLPGPRHGGRVLREEPAAGLPGDRRRASRPERRPTPPPPPSGRARGPPATTATGRTGARAPSRSCRRPPPPGASDPAPPATPSPARCTLLRPFRPNSRRNVHFDALGRGNRRGGAQDLARQVRRRSSGQVVMMRSAGTPFAAARAAP